jgi:hypothetical protein
VTGTLRVLRAEWYRLCHSRTAYGATLFLGAVAALRVFAAHLADRAAHLAAVQRALGQGRPAPPLPPPGNAWAPFLDGWLAGLTVATLLLLLFSARALAGDRESGLLRVARTRSASRGALVMGRAFLGVALVACAMLVTAGSALAAAAWLYDFGPVVEDGYELVGTSELYRELTLATAATLPPLVGTFCFGLLVSSFARTGTGAVAGALALYLGFDLFKEVLGERQYFVFAAFNPSFVDNSCLKELAGIARGFSDAGYPESLYYQNAWLPWPQAVLMLVLACWLGSRKAL